MKYLILIALLTSCGGGGGSGGNKKLNSLWSSGTTGLTVDFRGIEQSEEPQSVIFGNVDNETYCTCTVWIYGDFKSGDAAANSCYGNTSYCYLYEGEYSYSLTKDKLLVCDAYGCAIYK